MDSKKVLMLISLTGITVVNTTDIFATSLYDNQGTKPVIEMLLPYSPATDENFSDKVFKTKKEIHKHWKDIQKLVDTSKVERSEIEEMKSVNDLVDFKQWESIDLLNITDDEGTEQIPDVVKKYIKTFNVPLNNSLCLQISILPEYFDTHSCVLYDIKADMGEYFFPKEYKHKGMKVIVALLNKNLRIDNIVLERDYIKFIKAVSLLRKVNEGDLGSLFLEKEEMNILGKLMTPNLLNALSVCYGDVDRAQYDKSYRKTYNLVRDIFEQLRKSGKLTTESGFTQEELDDLSRLPWRLQTEEYKDNLDEMEGIRYIVMKI